MPLGALVGAPLAGWLVDYVGRKRSLLLCSVPLAMGWLLTVLSHIPADHHTPVLVLLFAGRFIVGIGVGSVSLCIPVSLYLLATFLASQLTILIYSVIRHTFNSSCT